MKKRRGSISYSRDMKFWNIIIAVDMGRLTLLQEMGNIWCFVK